MVGGSRAPKPCQAAGLGQRVQGSSASDCLALQDRPVKGAPSGRVGETMRKRYPADMTPRRGDSATASTTSTMDPAGAR
jgi:hypothetical protein